MTFGDGEHPISFLFEPRVVGAHVHVVVRSGQRGVRGLAGELVFRPEEWAALQVLFGKANDDAELGARLRSAIPQDLCLEPERLDGFNQFLLIGQGGHGGGRVIHIDATPFEVDGG